MKSTTWVAAILLAATSIGALAATPTSERRTVFKHYKQSLGSMNKMLSASSFDQAQFAQAAKSLASEAHTPWALFPASSRTSDTKPAIWSNPQGFKQASDGFEARVAELNQAVATCDVAQIRVGFRAVQQSCKACHDRFRN